MPRPLTSRQRRPRREPCDCRDCAEPAAAAAGPPAAHAAVARQDPPPKSLVVFLGGALCGSLADGLPEDGVECPHLDAVVRDGQAGLLALAAGGPPPLEQVLGSYGGGEPPPRLHERFMGLSAGMLADDAGALLAARRAGCAGPLEPLLRAGAAAAAGGDAWGSAAKAAARVAALLRVRPCEDEGPPGAFPSLDAWRGAAEAEAAAGDAAPGDELDMLFVCLDAGGEPARARAAMAWADDLVASLGRAPGFREGVLLTLVLAPATADGPPILEPPLAAAPPLLRPAGADFPPVRRPAQSHQLRGGARVAVAGGRPAVVAHRLGGVVRRDAAGAAGLRAAVADGGGGAIPAQRLLHELAYKLARAPKYGA